MIQFNQLIVFKILCFTRVCQKWWIQSLVQWKPHSPGQIFQSRTWADIFAFVLSCIINKQTNKQTNQTKQTNKGTKSSQSGTWADVSGPALLCSQQTACSQASAPPWREFDSFLKYSIRNTERQKPEFVCWETRNKFSTQVSIFAAALHPAARCRRLLCHKCIFFKVGRNLVRFPDPLV